MHRQVFNYMRLCLVTGNGKTQSTTTPYVMTNVLNRRELKWDAQPWFTQGTLRCDQFFFLRCCKSLMVVEPTRLITNWLYESIHLSKWQGSGLNLFRT